MKANNYVVIGLVVFVIATIFALQFMFSAIMPKYKWFEQFQIENEQPYGHKLLFELVSDTSTKLINRPLVEVFNDTTEDGTYVFLGTEIYLWRKNSDALLKWVEKGNEAMFIANAAPWFIDSIAGFNLDSVVYFEYTDSAQISLSEEIDADSTVYTYIHKNAYDTIDRQWQYVSDSVYVFQIEQEQKIKSLGRLYYGHNFFEIPYGKGKIFVHVEPYLFTNYHLLRDEGYEYATHVFSNLEKRGPIFWDHYSMRFHPEDSNESSPYMENSPLKVLFSNTALKHAWWVFIVGIVLYVLFRGKRQQRVIPLIHYPENTSKAYARALGALYHRTGEPKYLASEMMNMFHNYNRRKYQLQFDLNDKNFSRLLAKKAKVNAELIDNILNVGRRLEYSDLARMGEIADLYELLNTYYKSSK